MLYNNWCVVVFSHLFLSIYTQNSSLNIKKCYDRIYSAERMILKDRLDSALFFYKESFKLTDKPYAKDIYNAAVVADKLENFDFEFRLLKILRKKGISFEELSNNRKFSKLFSRIKKQKLEILKKEKSTFNVEYRNAIENIHKRDQLFRLKPNSYELYGDTIKKIDKENIKVFLELIAKFGFPNEERIGVKSFDEIRFPKYAIVITHQCMGPKQQYDFSNLLKKSMLNGDIENKLGYALYGQVIGNSDMENIVKTILVKKKNPDYSINTLGNTTVIDSTALGHFPFDKDMVKSKNLVRTAFYLDDFEISIKKILFNAEHREYMISAIGAISIFAYENKESFERMKKQLIYY